MKVCKFGGSSLADAAQIKKVCDIVLADPTRRAVIVSAPGKRYSEDTKVTDLLIALGNAVISGYDGQSELDKVVERFAGIVKELSLAHTVLEDITANLQSCVASYTGDRTLFMDVIKAAGENNCARLVAAYLNSIDRPALYVDLYKAGFFLTTENGRTKVLDETYDNVYQLKKYREILVFPGFFGYSKDGEVLTFSRGGSDITGAIVTAAMRASIYENWTDVDNVYAVNPALVRQPHAIKEITYDEMRELAYAGFTVLHEEALEPAFRRNIPVNIRNTNNPSAAGTMIVSERMDFDGILTGIAGKKGFVILHISKYLMNGEVGFALKILQILADLNIPFDHMPSGIDSLSIIMREEVFPPDKEQLVVRRLREELHIDHAYTERGVSIVMIVGAAMNQTVGVTSRACSALSHAGINLEFIIQGASEISVMFGVKNQYANYAVQTLYHEFYPFS